MGMSNADWHRMKNNPNIEQKIKKRALKKEFLKLALNHSRIRGQAEAGCLFPIIDQAGLLDRSDASEPGGSQPIVD